MFEEIKKHPRLLMEVELEPVQGDRFQPTGFPDIGAADYTTPDGTRKLLVESAQSMANRLEKTILDGEGPMLSKELKGLPYVVSNLVGDKETVTSSLMEAHRLNSPFIIADDELQANFKEKVGYRKGKKGDVLNWIDWKKIGSTFLFYDPNSIIHGVFMVNLKEGGSRIRLPRALTGFIEAIDIREVSCGGVKNNPLDPKGEIKAVNIDTDVYSNVPYHRTEYTAKKICAYFNLDIALLKGYSLPEEALDLLIALSLYKIRRFLNTGLRLRTACDLKVRGEIKVETPKGIVIPPEDKLLGIMRQKIEECKKFFAEPSVTKVTVETRKTSSKREKK
ncbi:MAG: type I-U CRISPR-associated protein Cas7 [Candidatus Eremiobacteraeota bacterium]|nr:type I-U CRISPR-associated protein Cas7 [Candidatus Eremiobacteraeota bacterium]